VCRDADGSVDLTGVELRTVRALLIMRELEFDAPLPWTPLSLWDWVRQETNGILFDGNATLSSCCGGSRTPVIAGRATSLTWDSIEGLIGVIVHETRHISFGGHTCGSLDRTIAEMGAFGVHNLFFQWMGSHTSPELLPPEYQRQSRLRACTQANSVFCNEPERKCATIN
jgi:hypothetical protein